MRGNHFTLLAVLILAGLPGAYAGTAFKATTTLTAETANNTSAANTFTSQTNGNLGATNISKLSMHNLLYSGSTAKIYVHLMPWFGFSNHMNVGYSSDDPAQVQRQLNDMVSRGLDGVIIDWFGQGTLDPDFASYSQVVQYFMQDSEQQPNFNFAIMDDAGSLKTCKSTPGCNLTQTLINDLTYAYNNWENSPTYLHYNGRPVVYFFGEEAYTLDWTQVRASVPGNPLFIFRNTPGFNYAESNGAFSWVAPETVSSTDPMALGYLDNFDQTVLSLWPVYSTESGYKGFNDSLASWGTGRLIQQQCGQTWLTSVAQSGKYFSTSKQMLGIQMATWNDYEEGTEIESGIDNCVTVSATVNGTVVSWSLSGQANTVDHYTVFLSQDGENLMWLADVPASTSQLDVAPYQMNAGNYMVFVKAVGKASLANQISASVSLTIPNQPPVAAFVFSGSNTSATVAAGQTATYNLSLTTGNSGFVGTVTVGCTGGPAGTTCSVSPSTVSFTASMVSAPVTITVATTQQARSTPSPGLLKGLPFAFAAVFAGLFGGVRKRTRQAVLAALAVLLICVVIGCAGGASSTTSPPPPTTPAPTNATLTVNGTSGAQSASTTLSLTITH